MRFERTERPKAPLARARRLRQRMTWAERELWKKLRRLDANFRRQAPIGPYVVDFAAHGPSLVIEVDGGVHERLDHVMERDAERQLWLESQGYRVLRIANRDVEQDLDGCVEKVRALLGRPSEPDEAVCLDAMRTPPSPALPPSRRKGE